MNQSMRSGSAFFIQFLRGHRRGSRPGFGLLSLIFINACAAFGQLFAQQPVVQLTGEVFRKAIQSSQTGWDRLITGSRV